MPKLTGVTPLEGFRLLLEYGAGERRLYDFTPHLSHKFYRSLADPALFRRVTVEDGELAWITGQDFCPHTLYDDSMPQCRKD